MLGMAQFPYRNTPITTGSNLRRRHSAIPTNFAANSGGFSFPEIYRGVQNPASKFQTYEMMLSKGFPVVFKKCQNCGGKGSIECPGCKGTGKNKKNGNIFERWKCFECQGFGLKGCPSCGKGGLTPEQRGER